MLKLELIKELEEIVGTKRVISSPEHLKAHGYDVGGEGRLIPGGMVFPSNAGQISAMMYLAKRENITVLPQGTGTRRHLSRSLERTLVISTLKMNRILDLDRESLKVTVEAGTPLKVLQGALDREGLYFPPYPWCFEGSTVGGCAASGIGGPASARHGVFKQFVLGMEVVPPFGELTRIGGHTVKNVVGYDLTSFFCGSEGSLGLLTSLTLRVVPKPPVEKLLIMGFPSTRAACASMDAVLSTGRGPERLSMLDRWAGRKMESFSNLKIPRYDGTTLLCQVAGIEAVVTAEEKAFLDRMKDYGGKVVAVAQRPDEIADLWHAQGRCLSAINEAAANIMTWDMVVPRKKAIYMMQKIEETTEQHPLNLIHGGYYGNGVFHPVILLSGDAPAERENGEAAFRDLFSFALSMGGNGAGPFQDVGMEMCKFHYPQSPSLSSLVQGIKKALDPDGIMKPLPLCRGILQRRDHETL